eukprot:scaffold17396_cov93-Skeletonema_marinoi.AAC.1
MFIYNALTESCQAVSAQSNFRSTMTDIIDDYAAFDIGTVVEEPQAISSNKQQPKKRRRRKRSLSQGSYASETSETSASSHH